MKEFLVKAFLFLCALGPLLSWASWKIEASAIDLVPCPDKTCYISKNCSVKSCKAFNALMNKKNAKSLHAGKNPGSEICRKDWKSDVNIATDENGNTEAICRFDDGSMVSLGGLWK